MCYDSIKSEKDQKRKKKLPTQAEKITQVIQKQQMAIIGGDPLFRLYGIIRDTKPNRRDLYATQAENQSWQGINGNHSQPSTYFTVLIEVNCNCGK